jgi:urea transporter
MTRAPRIRAGLYGYNGALVGVALATFLVPR